MEVAGSDQNVLGTFLILIVLNGKVINFMVMIIIMKMNSRTLFIEKYDSVLWLF